MKKVVSFLLVFIMLFSVNSYAGGGESAVDLLPVKGADSWAVEELTKAARRELVPYNLFNNFKKATTREEFCILAIRMMEVVAGCDMQLLMENSGIEIPPKGTFTDCDTVEVRIAKALGITDGTSATTFSPNDLLTREQAAKFLTTTAIACGVEVTLRTPPYADLDEISDWAKPYIGYLQDVGVMKGVGGNRFDPKGKYQRQQSFVTMRRMTRNINAIDISKNPNNDLSSFNPKDYENVGGYLHANPVVKDYKLVLTGSIDNEFSRDTVTEVYFKNNGNHILRREDFFIDGELQHIAFYNSMTNKTRIHRFDTDSKGKAKWKSVDEHSGDALGIPFLSMGYFEKVKNMEPKSDFGAKIINFNARTTLYIQHGYPTIGGMGRYWFDTKYRVPFKIIDEVGGGATRSELNKIYYDFKVTDELFDEKYIMN